MTIFTFIRIKERFFFQQQTTLLQTPFQVACYSRQKVCWIMQQEVQCSTVHWQRTFTVKKLVMQCSSVHSVIHCVTTPRNQHQKHKFSYKTRAYTRTHTCTDTNAHTQTPKSALRCCFALSPFYHKQWSMVMVFSLCLSL